MRKKEIKFLSRICDAIDILYFFYATQNVIEVKDKYEIHVRKIFAFQERT